jgi:Uncharacterized protein conserved in bacteria (DUF2262)
MNQIDNYLKQLQEFSMFGKSPNDKVPGKRYNLRIKNTPIEAHYHPYGGKPSGKECKLEYKKVERKINMIYEKILTYLCKKLYPSYKNHGWGDPHPVPYNAFKKKIRITAITVHPDCEITVRFDDGNLFKGHDLEVVLNKNFNPYEVNMEG